MMKHKKTVRFVLIFSSLVLALFLIMQPLEIIFARPFISVLFPAGSIGVKQRDLLLFIQALMLLVVVPVYFITYYFSWKYRAGNEKELYEPEGEDYVLAEYLWWGFPFLIILIISIVTWRATHQLDPYKPIPSKKKTMTIQVVALQWKWLFLYPEQKIASLNYVQFPAGTPIHFELTSDAPMNSFWIPKLGGQIYAMPKMKTHLHLIADEEGEFRGSSANISGTGFSRMVFTAKASSEEAFEEWAKEAKNSKLLDWKQYLTLAAPSIAPKPETFQLQEGLFDKILMKYMQPPEHKLGDKPQKREKD